MTVPVSIASIFLRISLDAASSYVTVMVHGVIAETGRMTDQKTELSESQMILLNQKLTLIDDTIQDGYHPMVTVVYFVPDAKKEGGSYQEYTGKVRQVDSAERKLFFLADNNRSAGKEISIEDVLEIHDDLVDYMDDI